MSTAYKMTQYVWTTVTSSTSYHNLNLLTRIEANRKILEQPQAKQNSSLVKRTISKAWSCSHQIRDSRNTRWTPNQNENHSRSDPIGVHGIVRSALCRAPMVFIRGQAPAHARPISRPRRCRPPRAPRTALFAQILAKYRLQTWIVSGIVPTAPR